MSLFEETSIGEAEHVPEQPKPLDPIPAEELFVPWIDNTKPLFEETRPVITRKVKMYIDADSLVYQAAHLGVKNAAIDPSNLSKFGASLELEAAVLEEQKAVFQSRVSYIRALAVELLEPRGIGISGVCLLFTPHSAYREKHGLRPNFRYQIVKDYNVEEQHVYDQVNSRRAPHEQLEFIPLPGYKHKRATAPKPANVTELLEWAINSDMETLPADGSEADDYAYRLKTEDKENILIAALDKDVLYGTPSGELGHLSFNEGKMVHVTDEEANLFVYRQCMMGDATDGIPGIRGCGIVRAKEALPAWEGHAAAWQSVMKKYSKEGYTEEYAILMMRLVYLGQLNVDFDLTLWEPKQF